MIAPIEALAGGKSKRAEKAKPAVIHTREGMEAAVNDYAQLKLKHLAVLARLEQSKKEVERKFESELNGLANDIELKFASVQNYCMVHRSELLNGDKKSFETISARLGFYDTPMRVEKRSSKETFGNIAKRLLGLVFKKGDEVVLDCEQYVRTADPDLDKNALLADRTKFTAEQLDAMGIKFERDEIFFIEPKSELTEGDKATT
jgi:phage host-nuclease inhibitor protein Gam